MKESNCEHCSKNQNIIEVKNGHIDGANLSNPTNIRFNIQNSRITEITKLSIRGSIIPVLNDEILKNFPNLKQIICSQCSIREISDDAFQSSKNIETIDLNGCQIGKIGENAFNRNQALKSIDLRRNLLNFLPKKLFYHLVNLKDLNLSANQLKEIDVDLFKHLYMLKSLYMEYNYLMDFNFEKIPKYTPYLQYIGLAGNEFHFDRLLQIVKLKQQFRTELKFHTSTIVERNRDYSVLFIENMDCVDDETFAKLVEKRELESSMVESKISDDEN